MIKYSIFDAAFAIEWSADKTEWRWAGCVNNDDDWYFSPWHSSSTFPSKAQFIAWVVTSIIEHDEE